MSNVQVPAKVLVVLEKPSNENESWGVTVPHVAGCFSAGESIEDALNNVREAILLHTEAEPVKLGRILELGNYDILLQMEMSNAVAIIVDVEVWMTRPDFIKDVPELSINNDHDKLMLKITSPIPRVAVGAIIIDNEGRVLTCRRPHGPENYVGKLHTFGGKVDLGETMYNAIVREVREECNIDVVKQAWKTDMVGVIEELEPECNIVVDGQTQLYHWTSAIWVFWLNDSTFKNMEPHKHHDMMFRDVKDMDPLDIAPSAYHSMVLAGLFEPCEEWHSVIDRENA